MTRRPIFIGIATVLALALTAGLAFGAGRLVGTQSRGTRPGRAQQVVVAGSMRVTHSNPQAQIGQGQTYGAAYRSQMRQWMHDWMHNHGWTHQSWTGHGQQGTPQNAGNAPSGNANGSGGWSSGQHSTGSGNWGGYGAHHSYQHSNGDHHGCSHHCDGCW